MRLRSIGFVAVLTLVVASCAAGTDEAAGPSEGIAVHGDWVIEVLHPDGSVDERVEFSNDLTEGGSAIASLLDPNSDHDVDTWIILVGATTASSEVSPCTDAETLSANPDFEVGCRITLPPGGDLAVEVTGPNSESLSVAGSTVAERDGAIDWVETVVGDFRLGWLNSFTGTAIGDVPVVAGQTVSVQVDISFATG